MDVSVSVVGAGASGLAAAMTLFMHGTGLVGRCVLLTASKIQLTKPHMQIVRVHQLCQLLCPSF